MVDAGTITHEGTYTELKTMGILKQVAQTMAEDDEEAKEGEKQYEEACEKTSGGGELETNGAQGVQVETVGVENEANEEEKGTDVVKDDEETNLETTEVVIHMETADKEVASAPEGTQVKPKRASGGGVPFRIYKFYAFSQGGWACIAECKR